MNPYHFTQHEIEVTGYIITPVGLYVNADEIKKKIAAALSTENCAVSVSVSINTELPKKGTHHVI